MVSGRYGYANAAVRPPRKEAMDAVKNRCAKRLARKGGDSPGSGKLMEDRECDEIFGSYLCKMTDLLRQSEKDNKLHVEVNEIS